LTRSTESAGTGSVIDLFSRVADEIAVQVDVAAVLDAIVEQTAIAFGGDECHLFLFDDQEVRVFASYGVAEPLPPHSRAELEDGLSGWVVREGKAIASADTTRDPRNRGLAMDRAIEVGARSIAVAPLRARGETIGTLTILADPGVLTENTVDLDMLEIISIHAAQQILASEMLAQAESDKRALQAQHEAVSRFAGERRETLSVIAHELRNAVAAVQLGLNMMTEAGGDLEPELAQVMEITSISADDAFAIVSEILSPEGVNSGRLVNAEDVDLVALMQAVALAARLDLAMAPEAAIVRADPIRIRQIVRNLIDNAEKHGGASITLGIAATADTAAVLVCDDGNAIPNETQAMMFDRSVSTGDRGGPRPSLGIGLAVSRELARAMGGELTHERCNDLTEFRVTFPMAAQR